MPENKWYHSRWMVFLIYTALVLRMLASTVQTSLRALSSMGL